MGSIFIRYGVKSGGGAPFLRRTRNAFGQLQARTRTGGNSTQRQQRTRSCSCTSNFYIERSGGTCDGNTQRRCDTWYVGGGCTASRPWCGTQCNNSSGSSVCITSGTMDDGYWQAGHLCCEVSASVNSHNSCNWGGFSGWSSSPSCSATSQPCNANGKITRECRNATVCSFGSFTSWSNTSTCSAATPNCSSGAVIRECQTLYSFREEDWSSFEEAEICVSSSLAAALGAVQVECIPN